MSLDYDNSIKSSLECAQQFHRNVCRTAEEFKILRTNLVQQLPTTTNNLENNINDSTRFQQVSNELIDEHAKMNRPTLVVFGANSSGKTSFIQRFVGIGDILPSDFGPVTARIVQLTYALPDQACFQVYNSIEKTEIIQSKTDLSIYFKDPTEPDWDGIATVLLPYVQRPQEINENSDEFHQWAKCFVEICLPSDVLSLGIDVYDTPGFLSDNREEILTDNLHQLVVRSKPTLLFLYDNATISDTDKSCFLAMKNALGQMERISTFFLNTKADCITIANDYSLDDDPDNISLEQFEDILHKKRQCCYELLLRRHEMANEMLGGAPDLFINCTFFDICTIPRNYDPWEIYTNHINSSTFKRIVRFTIESYSGSTLMLSEDILRTIDDYFDLVVSTTSRLPQQWDQLRKEAVDWGEKFFDEYEKLIPNLADELHEKILSTFAKAKQEIIRQAALTIRTDDPIDTLLRDNSKTIRKYVQLAVQEHIIKVAANETIINKRNDIQNLIADHFQQKRFQGKNELLSLSQRYVLSDISAEILKHPENVSIILSTLTNISMQVSRFIRSLPTLLSINQKKLYNRFIQKQVQENKAADVYNLLDAMDEYATLSNEAGRRKLAEYCLNKIEDDIKQKKEQFGQILTRWILNQKETFNKNIELNYQYIIDNLSNKEILNNIISPFVKSFAKIECQLLAAIELNRRKGIVPILGQEIGRGGFYSVHEIQWDSDKNLAVKRLLEPTDDNIKMSALEAHYHRIATLLNLDSIAPLLSIYDNQQELWLIMPRYPRSLRQYLQQTRQTDLNFPRIVSLAIVIAQALEYLHSIGIVHRDLKASNIMLDENEQCYLIDFGTAKFGLSNTTVVGTFPLPPEIIDIHFKQQTGVSQYDGTAADVYAFGILLYEMLPKNGYDRLTRDTISNLDNLLNTHSLLDYNTTEYKKLIHACLKENPTDRPKFSKLVCDLQTILKQTEVKECMICHSADRDIRFQPCHHKVACQICWEAWVRSPNGNNRCIFCKTIVTNFIQDNSNATFIV